MLLVSSLCSFITFSAFFFDLLYLHVKVLRLSCDDVGNPETTPWLSRFAEGTAKQNGSEVFT